MKPVMRPQETAKKASDLLLEKWDVYVQAINYPTVPVGQERLRITPTPGHTREFREHLVRAVTGVWEELGIKKTSEWAAKGGFIGVGVEGGVVEDPLWKDEQLGIDRMVGKMETGGALGALESVLEAHKPVAVAASA